MEEFEKRLLDKLMSRGEVEVRGLQLDAMCNFIHRKVLTNPEVWGVIVYEARQEDGFFRDTTNAHVVAVGATFMPYFDGEYFLVVRNDEDYNAICELEPLEVKPATKEEMEELCAILSKWYENNFLASRTSWCTMCTMSIFRSQS